MAPASARARRVSGCSAGVGSEEQIAEGTAQQVGDAAPGEMMRPVVNEMAALTQASQVLQPIVAWIVIEVGSGQNDAGLPHASRFFDVGLSGPDGRDDCARSDGSRRTTVHPAERKRFRHADARSTDRRRRRARTAHGC